MGIKRLWEVIDSKGVRQVNIAQYVATHLEQNRRPFRIAVDAAYWLFRNLNNRQVNDIRRNFQPASNPVEKAIMYRVLRYKQLGAQMLFVFDGKARPNKPGRKIGFQQYQANTTLLKDTLSMIGVPCWDAPAEAEAECAALQLAGIVDAVFSGDADALMFGSSAQIRFQYEGRDEASMKPSTSRGDRPQNFRASVKRSTERKSNSHVLITDKYDLQRHGIESRDDLVLIAILAGGDYDPEGLRNCGIETALEALKAGFGTSLGEAYRNRSFEKWRDDLRQFLKNVRRNIEVPAEFPDHTTLEAYMEPRASSAKSLHTYVLGCGGWNRYIDHEKLSSFLPDKYNFSAEEYVKWILPVAAVDLLLAKENVASLDLKRIRKVSKQVYGLASVSQVDLLMDSLSGSHDQLSNVLRRWPRKIRGGRSEAKGYDPPLRVRVEVLDSITSFAAPELFLRDSALIDTASCGETPCLDAE